MIIQKSDMRKRKNRTIVYLCILCIMMVTLEGCGIIPSLNLTEEQSSLISEYAAGKLIEYAKGHPGGLMEVDDIDRADVNPGMKKEEKPDPGLPPLPEGNVPSPDGEMPPAEDDAFVEQPAEASPDQEALVDVPDEVADVPTQSIAQALGLEGAEVTYDHYEVTASYPENAEELAFSMKAAAGKELLIVHFNLTNPGDSEIQAHTDSSGFKIRLLLNGSEKLRGDVTFLDNDLMNYNGLLTAGSLVDSILVFEVQEGTTIESMELLIVGDDGEDRYPLM